MYLVLPLDFSASSSWNCFLWSPVMFMHFLSSVFAGPASMTHNRVTSDLKNQPVDISSHPMTSSNWKLAKIDNHFINGLGFIHIHTQDLLAFIINQYCSPYTSPCLSSFKPSPLYSQGFTILYKQISRVDPKRWLA